MDMLYKRDNFEKLVQNLMPFIDPTRTYYNVNTPTEADASTDVIDGIDSTGVRYNDNIPIEIDNSFENRGKNSYTGVNSCVNIPIIPPIEVNASADIIEVDNSIDENTGDYTFNGVNNGENIPTEINSSVDDSVNKCGDSNYYHKQTSVLQLIFNNSFQEADLPRYKNELFHPNF